VFYSKLFLQKISFIIFFRGYIYNEAYLIEVNKIKANIAISIDRVFAMLQTGLARQTRPPQAPQVPQMQHLQHLQHPQQQQQLSFLLLYKLSKLSAHFLVKKS
jgi:hypothetical protein